MTDAQRTAAIDILKINDRGSYTVPTSGLYPFQWNWDSCLTALGQRHFDAPRALTEIETLFAHQWPCGMVPHIVFHQLDDGYFPGPDVWDCRRPVPTSGITQPPVAGFALRRLLDGAPDLRDRARPLVAQITAWHRWFHATRDPGDTGLVAIIHPWESGRDNSVDWDIPFQRVPTDGIAPYTRRDTQHANPAHRPTKDQYDRYIWLVERFRKLNWQTDLLHDASPFQVVDPGFNAILIRSCLDLADVAAAMGEDDLAAQNRTMAEAGLAALPALWSEAHGQYLCLDRGTGQLIDSPSSGGLLTVFAPIPADHAATIAATIDAQPTRYRVASHAPGTPGFDAKRYWRGPVWLVVNYMIADGLARAGQKEAADQVTASSLELIHQSGFAEYYDPLDGEGLGGGQFTWTAAMVLEFLAGER
ncbi:MGH1-like glycoside hydrolase domain-containing protein [Roseicitreum antarcticum]|uniref:Trehalase n=1 Tax=Roseicitreum antarcticum TaxID=564137 RepID=A0A1H2TU94_9RHOB|nr:trehalase family glycosidase [Roseicitreum antarcticum]SDW46899.1 Trehalase [Roseicitreum antarcticum]